MSAKLAKAVCAEKDFVGAVICHEDLRPVYHRRTDEAQDMISELKCVTLFYNDSSLSILFALEEVLHHTERLLRAYDRSSRKSIHKPCDTAGMVWLHVLYYKVIRLPVAKHSLDVADPLICKITVYGVHDSHFCIVDQV